MSLGFFHHEGSLIVSRHNAQSVPHKDKGEYFEFENENYNRVVVPNMPGYF